MVEISPALSTIQAQNLCTYIEENNPADFKTLTQENSIGHYKKGITEDGVEVYWYYSVTDIPKKFSVFLAHEFFDALPIHKFQVLEIKRKRITFYCNYIIASIHCIWLLQ